MLAFFASLVSVYLLCWIIYPTLIAHLGLHPDGQFCTDGEESCSRPDLFAFQTSSSLSQCFCGILGFITWNVNQRAHKGIPYSPEGRIYSYLDESEKIAAANFTYQIFNILFSLFTPENVTWILYFHHILAAFVCWLSLHYQYLHYYGVLFLGLSEFSSIFLVVVDMARYFPPISGTSYDLVVNICRPAFAVSFFYCRILLWLKVSRQLWSDASTVIFTGTAEKFRPGKIFGLYTFLFLNVILTILQMYWMGLIVRVALEMF